MLAKTKKKPSETHQRTKKITNRFTNKTNYSPVSGVILTPNTNKGLRMIPVNKTIKKHMSD